MTGFSSCIRESVYSLFLLCTMGTLIMFSSCKNEILVGSELLDDENILVDVTDQVTLTSKLVYSEPFISFDSTSTERRLVYLGQLNDLTFGKLTPELGLSFNINAAAPPNYPIGEKKLVADSLVLILTYDTLGTYGDISGNFRIEVSELGEKIPAGKTLSSDLSLMTGASLIDTTIAVHPLDSVRIITHSDGKIVKQLPQMRIRFSKEFATRLLNDAPAALSDSAFVSFLKGIKIKASPLNNPGIIGFNFSTSALSSTLSNKMILYYTESDTLKKTYNYNINRRFVNTIENDYSGSMLDQHVQDSVLSNQMGFIQGLGGPKMVVSLSNLDFLKDKVVNYAQLIVTGESSSGLTGKYDALNQLIAQRKNADGEFEFITDVYGTLSNIITVFGGDKKDAEGRATYTMNITNHVKEALKDATVDSDIYLTVTSPREVVQRSVLFGAGHDTYKMRLKIHFTTK
ncbi:MAG: hypothetical protein WAT79_06175 [Saprospiraceae bacterium]